MSYRSEKYKYNWQEYYQRNKALLSARAREYYRNKKKQQKPDYEIHKDYRIPYNKLAEEPTMFTITKLFPYTEYVTYGSQGAVYKECPPLYFNKVSIQCHKCQEVKYRGLPTFFTSFNCICHTCQTTQRVKV